MSRSMLGSQLSEALAALAWPLLASTPGCVAPAASPLTLDAGPATDAASVEDAFVADAGFDDAGFDVAALDAAAGEDAASAADAAILPPEEPPLPPSRFGPRDLFVSEPSLLGGLSFERTLAALTSSAGTPGQPLRELYRNWWDALNTEVGGVSDAVVHCDEPNPESALNDFPSACPGHEGALAFVDPFGPKALYIPVGAVNRFDLSAPDGSTCGEYRLIFAARDREHFVIVEAVLPNPTPSLGASACRPVAQFWSELADPARTDAVVAAALARFYFEGIAGFAPAIHIDHLGGGPGGGRIRTNTEDPSELVAPDGVIEWSMLEFAARTDCEGGSCRVAIERRPVGATPHAQLLDGSDPRSAMLEDAIVEQLPRIAAAEIHRIEFTAPPETLANQSIIIDGPVVLRHEDIAATNRPFLDRLAARRAELGIALTDAEIFTRVESQTCSGCHRGTNSREIGDGLTWPRSMGFTHVDRGGNLSEALLDVFLPARRRALEAALE